jgi:hypothetical protein
MNPFLHYFLDWEQQDEPFEGSQTFAHDFLFALSAQLTFLDVRLSVDFTGGISFFPTSLTVIITPAATMITIKISFVQRLLFFLGVQQPSLQPQSCFALV